MCDFCTERGRCERGRFRWCGLPPISQWTLAKLGTAVRHRCAICAIVVVQTSGSEPAQYRICISVATLILIERFTLGLNDFGITFCPLGMDSARGSLVNVYYVHMYYIYVRNLSVIFDTILQNITALKHLKKYTFSLPIIFTL